MLSKRGQEDSKANTKICRTMHLLKIKGQKSDPQHSGYWITQRQKFIQSGERNQLDI